MRRSAPFPHPWPMLLLVVAALFASSACHGNTGETKDGGTWNPPDGSTPLPPDAGTDAGQPRGPFHAIAYIGGYNSKISRYRVDLDAGTFTHLSDVDGGSSASSFLALSPDQRFLYAADENTDQISSFSVDPSDGTLKLLATVSSGGFGPAFVGVDHTGHWVFAPNYSSGHATVLPAYPDGGLGAPTSRPVAGVKAHMMIAAPSNKYVFVPCLGSDHVAQYVFNDATGELSPNSPADLNVDGGSGPRHFAFAPDGAHAYLINELQSTVHSLTYDADHGRLSAFQVQSSLPPGTTGKSTAAEIAVHPSGRFVYASNRGADDIAVFHVDASTGALSPFKYVSTHGMQPRHFSLDPDGHLLFVANQDSNTVYSFWVSPTDGDLTLIGKVADFTSPSYVGVVFLPEN